jgi:hypothetical protein
LQFTFEEGLTQLADYKEKNGDCNVPYSFEGYGNLGQWVAYQRRNYKLYKRGVKSSLTIETIIELWYENDENDENERKLEVIQRTIEKK